MPTFHTGEVHGDFNLTNILVREAATNNNLIGPKDHVVCGIIDFEFAAHTYYVFDVAISMAYMYLQNNGKDPLLMTAHFLAGYLSMRSLNEHEFDALKLCVEARLAQSLVVGAYSFAKDPENEYLLYSSKNGWAYLQRLRDTPRDDLYRDWNSVIEGYAK